MRWVFWVFGPVGRVVPDVVANGVQFPFVADDAFVIIALPQGIAGRVTDFVDAFGYGGFVSGDERTQRFGRWPAWR